MNVLFHTGFDVLRQMPVLCLVVLPFSGIKVLKPRKNYMSKSCEIVNYSHYPLHRASMLPLGRAAMRPLASFTMTWRAPLDFLVRLEGEDSPGRYLSATIISPRWVGVALNSSAISDYGIRNIIVEKSKWYTLKNKDKLTRSWSWYQCGVGSSNIRPAKGRVISPRKSFRPNMSLCQTVSHKVRFSKSDNDVVN